MSDRHLHCEAAKEAAAGKNAANGDRAAKIPETRQSGGDDPCNDEVRRDRYRMR